MIKMAAFEKNQEEPKVPKGRDWEWEGILHHRGEAKGVFGARVGALPAAFADGRGFVWDCNRCRAGQLKTPQD